MNDKIWVYCQGGCGASTWYSNCVPAWKQSVVDVNVHRKLRQRCTCAEA